MTLSCLSVTSSHSILACARGGSFSVEIAEERPGTLIMRVSGKGAVDVFSAEAGGHRWQRVPPTERKGRVHTSTVTVAVLREPTATELVICDDDLEWSTCRGSGPGGQKRNKTESTVIVRHLPSGLTVRCESERSQLQNRVTALALLRAHLLAITNDSVTEKRCDDRRGQVGSGMRGDKRRTVQLQNDIVVDHVTGRRARVREYLREGPDALC